MSKHHCSEEGCSTTQHSTGGNKCACGCECGSCCGSSCNCGCHQQQNECHFSDQLLAMADEAWMELVKEKIKKKIEESSGNHLDKLAEIVSQANHERWNNKMGIAKLKEDFKSQIQEFFQG